MVLMAGAEIYGTVVAREEGEKVSQADTDFFGLGERITIKLGERKERD